MTFHSPAGSKPLAHAWGRLTQVHAGVKARRHSRHDLVFALREVAFEAGRWADAVESSYKPEEVTNE